MIDIASLRFSLFIWEYVEYASVVIVILGVVGEYIAQFTKVSKCEPAKQTLEKHSTLVLIVGLVIVLVALERISATNGRISDALNEETEALRAANLELEAVIQPRRLTSDQQKGIVAVLAPFAGRSVGVESYGFDVDGLVLAWQLENVFVAANLKVDRKDFIGAGGGLELGVNVRGSDAELVKAIASALRSIAGLQSVSENLPAFKHSTIIGGSRASGQVVIMVGAKPLANPTIPLIKRGP